MRGTPNEFFSFLPDHERTAAIQAFAIIRRCDETLRFEALVGSWLVSRLITILRIDGSALKTVVSTVDPTTDSTIMAAASFETDSSRPVAIGSTSSSSTMIDHPNGNVKAINGPHQGSAFSGPYTSTNSQQDPSSKPNSISNVPTANSNSDVPPGVVMPTYHSHHKAQNPGTESIESIPPGLQIPPPPAHLKQQYSQAAPSVRDESNNNIVSDNIMTNSEDDNKNKSNDKSKNPGEFDPDNPIPNDKPKRPETPRPITSRRIIVSSDKPLFMYVGHLQSSGAAMNGFATHLAGIISSFSTTKGTSTTVASTISYCLNLLEHSEHRSKLLNGLCSIIIHCHPSMRNINDDDDKALDDDSDGIIIPEKARMDLRRILTTALCCILLQVKTSCESVQDFDYIWEACCDKAVGISSIFQDDDPVSKECAWLLSIGSYLSEDLVSQSLTHADRRKIRLLLSGASILMVSQSSLLLKQEKSSNLFAEEPPMKRQRFDCGQNKAYEHFRAAQLRQESNAIAQLCKIGKKVDPEGGAGEPTEVSEETRNSTKKKSRTSLLDIILDAINDLSSSEKRIEAKTLSEEFKKVAQVASSTGLFDQVIQNVQNVLVSSTPIESKFSTYHGRVSSVEVLEKFCKVLLSSTQNSYSPNGPSIFTGFSFVDETLLVAENTTYVRLYLIDYNEREEALSVEHVAANVRFYKKDPNPEIESEREDRTEPIERLHVQLKKGDIFETLDFNAWTEMLLESSSKRIKPSTKLYYYIGCCNKKNAFSSKQVTVGEVMIPVLNKALERLSQSETNDPEKHLYVDPTGKMRANYQSDSSRISLQAKIIWRALVSLYYDALESILDYETARIKSTSHPCILMNPSFHKALLSICLICVVHATSGNSANLQHEKNGFGSNLFVQSILKLMDCTSYEYMKVSESFSLSMEKTSLNLNKTIHKVPELILKKLHDAEIQLLESLLWSSCPNASSERTTVRVLGSLMSSKNSSLWPPKILEPIQDEKIFNELDITTTEADVSTQSFPRLDFSSESSYVDYITTKLLSLVSKRVAILCGHLNIPPHYQVTKQVWYTFRQLLRKKIYLLYDRNVDQLILCTIYGTCKVMRYKPEITFSKIIKVYNSCFEDRLDKADAQQIIRNVTMKSSGHIGTVIEFYNKIYLPTMKKYLLKSKSMANNRQEHLDKTPDTAAIFQSRRQPGMMKLQDSNIHLNVAADSTPLLRNESPRTRVLYAFGDASSMKVSFK